MSGHPISDDVTLSAAELLHYSRQMILPEIGKSGQAALKAARVLMVGAGGLGSPVGLYLAAAGVGTLGIVEFDRIEASNLHRQILYSQDQIGSSKLDAAKARLRALNPHVQIVAHALRLDASNAVALISEYDLVVDGTDNFATRYLINDACVIAGKRNVHASVYRFDGLLSVFGDTGGPCYRCLYPEPPPPGMSPSCSEAGVLGAVPGVLGALQATEAIKLLLGIGAPLIGRLLQIDALTMRFNEFDIERDPCCSMCSENAGQRVLIDYETFCGFLPSTATSGKAIDVARLQQQRGAAAPPLLIDVRSPTEFAIAHIDGAQLMPLAELSQHLPRLRAATSIVCYCQTGARSRQALQVLEQAGLHDAVSLTGGMVAWLEAMSHHVPEQFRGGRAMTACAEPNEYIDLQGMD